MGPVFYKNKKKIHKRRFNLLAKTPKIVKFVKNAWAIFFKKNPKQSGFFPGGDGGNPIRQNFCQSPPIDTCPRFWTKACPPPAEVRPRKFEKFKYIFVSNLTTFKLKSKKKAVFHA